jgi:hypothetical protein
MLPAGLQKVKVDLVGEDGNALLILGRVTRAMKKAGYPKNVIDSFLKEAQSGDFDHLLQTVMEWTEDSDEDGEE